MSTAQSTGNLKPELVEPGKKPKGKKVSNWGILLKVDTTDDQKILKKFLAAVEKHEFKDKHKTISLQYQWFKSKDIDQLYNFVLYRLTDETSEAGKPKTKNNHFEHADEVPSRTSGPTPPKPPTGVVEIFERELTLQPS